MKLPEKVALVTGAGSGIGAAACHHMAREGASITAAGIPAEGVNHVASSLQAAGHRAVGIVTDVSQPEQVKAAVDATVEMYGRLDIVVASAAVQLHDRDHTLHELDESVWDQTHDVNFRGVFLTCKMAIAQMLLQETGGSIIIIASITGLDGGSANPAYLTGKHALLGLNQHIAVHYGGRGIRCNALLPGALERTPNHDIHPAPDARAARLTAAIPMGRTGTPDDIAPWIVFLASDDARYACGSNIVVDGGLTAG